MKWTTFQMKVFWNKTNDLSNKGFLKWNEWPLRRRLSHVCASLFLWNLISLEKENMPRTMGVNVGICFLNRRGERRERERESTWANG
jgi:hypothetical protein